MGDYAMTKLKCKQYAADWGRWVNGQGPPLQRLIAPATGQTPDIWEDYLEDQFIDFRQPTTWRLKPNSCKIRIYAHETEYAIKLHTCIWDSGPEPDLSPVNNCWVTAWIEIKNLSTYNERGE